MWSIFLWLHIDVFCEHRGTDREAKSDQQSGASSPGARQPAARWCGEREGRGQAENTELKEGL